MLGLRDAWVAQPLDFLLSASDLQAAFLVLKAVDGLEHMSERANRAIARAGS